MTQRERLLALLAEFGITPAPVEDFEMRDPHDVVVAAKHGGVEGYSGFECVFTFDAEGRFVCVGVWE
ncbi:MAG: hypothetical protein JWN35_2793 [Frankiales bacterium]|jgi:hypothetical protein|nr:hypothetical protein [Frankiales bacterium]